MDFGITIYIYGSRPWIELTSSCNYPLEFDSGIL